MKTALPLLLGLLLAGCATGSKTPVQTYDFGIADPATPPEGVDVFISEVRAAEWLSTTDMLYRLEYRDPRVLTPYSASRWAGSPSAMLTTRLRLLVGTGAAARDKKTKCTLTLFLSEFSQAFKTEKDSRAVIRMRATLTDYTSTDRAQSREFRIERSAPTPDAAGAASAFAEAVKGAGEEINKWIELTGSCRD